MTVDPKASLTNPQGLPNGGEYLLHGIPDDFSALGFSDPRLEKRFQTPQRFFFGQGLILRQVGQGTLKDIVFETLAMQRGGGF